jgi:hypothetical protein
MKLTHRLFEKSLILFLIVGLFSGLSVMSVHGVTRNKLTIANLDTSLFPNISLYFWAFDGTGAFVKNIQGSELHILENETVIAATSLEMLEPGVRFITVINEGRILTNRYSMVAHIDSVKAALLAWAQAQPATSMDDFSLVNNQGAIAYNQSNPEDWQETINNYLPQMRQATPGLAGLSAALDQAISASGPTRKTPAILYVTPVPEASQADGLRDLISRAVTSGVRLFIWLVVPQNYTTTETDALLMQAAEETDGEFFIFSGAEDLPEISSYLDPLKYVYHLTYKSGVKTSGNQTIKLQVRRLSVVLDSAEVSFPLTVGAPNPIFLSPPASVTRTWVETDKRREYILTPDVVEIAYMLEFPDGHQRDLSYARLLVDGKLAAEDTSLPFDSLTWDIGEIQTSGSYQLQLVVQDVVGLQGETIEVPVDIVVGEKPLTWFQRLTAKFSWLTFIPIALVAGSAVLILLIGWKTIRKNLAVRSARSHRLQDPVTQPVEISGEPVILASKADSLDSWPRIPGIGPALARLLLLASGIPGTPERHEIPIGEFEITLGSDSSKAKVLLNYPLVSPLHARIFMDEEKKFRVADLNSAAGTWLNYAPVSSRGAHLEHGDVLQFGRASFRFEQLGVETKKLRVVRLPDEE